MLHRGVAPMHGWGERGEERANQLTKHLVSIGGGNAGSNAIGHCGRNFNDRIENRRIISL